MCKTTQICYNQDIRLKVFQSLQKPSMPVPAHLNTFLLRKDKLTGLWPLQRGPLRVKPMLMMSKQLKLLIKASLTFRGISPAKLSSLIPQVSVFPLTLKLRKLRLIRTWWSLNCVWIPKLKLSRNSLVWIWKNSRNLIKSSTNDSDRSE